MNPSHHRLDNGLHVVLDPMATVESLTLGVWIQVGSRHEPEGLNGLAHLLEHMVFKGTRARSAFDIVSQIEGRGGSINAYTSRENTAYYCRLLGEDLPLGLDILADMIAQATLKADDLEKERHVILSEIHQAQDTPDDIIFDCFQETAFPNQGLGNPVLGRESVLNSVGEAPLRAFRDRVYSANSMTLVVSGKFDRDQALDLIRTRFGPIPAGARLGFSPGIYKGGEFIQIRQDLEQFHLLLGWPGAALEGPGYYAQMLISTLLGGGMSSRLFQKVREEEGLAYSISAYLSAFHDCGLFTAYAATEPDQLTQLLPLMAKTMWSLCDDLSEDELARAKQLIRAGLLMAQESTLSRAESFAGQMQVFGKLMTNAQLLAPLEGVSTQDIQAAIRPLLSQPMTLAIIGPEKPALGLSEVENLFKRTLN